MFQLSLLADACRAYGGSPQGKVVVTESSTIFRHGTVAQQDKKNCKFLIDLRLFDFV